MTEPTYTMTPNEPGWWWWEHGDSPREVRRACDVESCCDGDGLVTGHKFARRVEDLKIGLWYGPLNKPKFPHFQTTVEEVRVEEERQAKELAALTPEQRECYDENMRDATERFRQMLKDRIN